MEKEILLAAYHGDIEELKACLADKAEINIKDDSGYTPLHWVCFLSEVGEHREEMVRLLVDAGADVNSVLPNEGPSILSSACASGNPDIIRLLIENGADINFHGDGETPLIHAIQSGVADSVSILLESGCDYKLTDASGRTSIEVAEINDRPEIAELIKQFITKH